MNRIRAEKNWPESWLKSYEYDRQEVYGELVHRGYAYAYESRMSHTLEMVRKVAAPVAAAQGNFSLTLAEEGYEVTWNDLREELVDYVKLKHSHGRISYRPGNVFALDLSDDPYDVVLITEIIEHVAHPDNFLKQVASLVKPGGHIVMTTPNGEYFRSRLPKFSDCPDPSLFESVQFKPNSDGHIFLLHEDEVYLFAKDAGLVVQELRFFTTPVTNGHMKTEHLLRIMPKAIVNAQESVCRTLPHSLQKKLCLQMGAILFKPPTVS
jgi:2-polyprenyl-6-hydroxyphenyl methylase/3-demethylubiquinone-9 3-methyltransferase